MLESNLSADLGAGNRGGTCVCASLFVSWTASGPAACVKLIAARLTLPQVEGTRPSRRKRSPR
jgi:hypothetical protein